MRELSGPVEFDTAPSGPDPTAAGQYATKEYVDAHSGAGTVTSVNDVEPDDSGNVTLTPASIGALAPSGSGAALTGITAAQIGADASGLAAAAQTDAEAASLSLASGGTVAGATAFTSTVTAQTPTQAGQVAIKSYVDSVAAGLDAKPSVAALAASNITLSGTQTIDGVAVTAGQRVLCTGQSTGSQNGLWVVASGSWTRPTDFASASTQLGAFSFVEAGTAGGSSGWTLVGATAVTVDTSSQTWTQFSGAGEVLAGTGLTKTGNTLALTTPVASANLPAATTSAQGAVKLDGTATDIQASPGTQAAGSTGQSADAGHVHPQPPFLAPTGLTGATAASRFVGFTASGSPATGTFAVGDVVFSQNGAIWTCTAAGSPGSWNKISIQNFSAGSIAPSPGTQAAGSVGSVSDAGHVHGQPPMFAPTGLTGATAASRYAGATASGSPASGTFVAGDWVIDQTGKIWVCSAPGSPGTWQMLMRRDSSAADIQPVGTASAGSTFLAADSGHVHPGDFGFSAADYGLLGWTYDPIWMNDASAFSNGVLYLVRLNLRGATTISKVAYWLNSSASGMTANENYVGVYNPSGTLLRASSAGVAETFNDSTVNLCPLSSPVAAGSVPFIWAAYLFNASSPADFLLFEGIGGGSGLWNGPLGAAAARFGTYGSGLTTLPSSITPGSISIFGMNGMWGGIA